MQRRIIILLSLTLILSSSILFAQALPGYYERSRFLMAPPGSFQDGLVGFTNPANLTMIRNFESRFIWSTDDKKLNSFNDWGLFAGEHGLGFTLFQQKFPLGKVTDYKISLAGGSKSVAFGLGYGWSKFSSAALEHGRLLTFGLLLRPNRFISAGYVANYTAKEKEYENIFDLGLRPLGTAAITLFADAALPKDTKITDANWSTGAAVQFATGIYLVGRYFDSQAFTLGISLNLGGSSLTAQSHYNTEQNYASSTFGLRLGDIHPDIFSRTLPKANKYIPMNLSGRVDYHRTLFFSGKVHPFYKLLRDLQNAAADPRVAVIAVNLSETEILPEHALEVREVLQQARTAGKKIVVFLETADMTTYHLASVADKIVLDPEGIITLLGYRLGRTFFKGTLDKLGLGFDEWRLFKYKSALGTFSRDSMSSADREQRQDYVNDLYKQTRQDVCASRGFTPAQYDSLINNKIMFLADKALKDGLVDTLARWSAIDEVLKKLTGAKKEKLSVNLVWDEDLYTEQWGDLPKIALVYGIGVCAMDEGIRARWLERVFLKLANQKDVCAVVFRVDSPGGDGMASDLVAQALKKCSEKKPVIISQGQVAGSGGYWISMYGKKIVAEATTITGSIGVIGGWLYDKGFSAKLGMTADHVRRGEHADLGFGVRLPLLPIIIPARNLTPVERSQVDIFINDFYEGFVAKVAAGRKMAVDEVKKIAEGHFYSGIAGQKIGLVDEIGGLLTAIKLAKQEAKLKPDAAIDLIEIPKFRGLFGFGLGLVSTTSQLESDPVFQYLHMWCEQPGKPLPLLEPGTYPTLKSE